MSGFIVPALATFGGGHVHLLSGPSLHKVVLVLSLRLAVFGLSLPAQFIVDVVSAVSWTPVSFHLAWMSAVVAWGLASSCASNLWI